MLMCHCMQEVKANPAKAHGPSDKLPVAQADDSSKQHLKHAAMVGGETATESLPTSDMHPAVDSLLDFEEAAAYEAEVRQFLAGSLEETTFQLLRSGRPVSSASYLAEVRCCLVMTCLLSRMEPPVDVVAL